MPCLRQSYTKRGEIHRCLCQCRLHLNMMWNYGIIGFAGGKDKSCRGTMTDLHIYKTCNLFQLKWGLPVWDLLLDQVADCKARYLKFPQSSALALEFSIVQKFQLLNISHQLGLFACTSQSFWMSYRITDNIIPLGTDNVHKMSGYVMEAQGNQQGISYFGRWKMLFDELGNYFWKHM